MAARRLIAVMLVLLFLSSLAAALAPVERSSDETSTSTTDAITQPVREQGDVVKATLEGDSKNPQRIEASVGDQLQLRVSSPRVATIELVGLGPTEDVDPIAPALFDVLLETRGRYEVRELESRQELGTIVVKDRRLNNAGARLRPTDSASLTRAPTEPDPEQAPSRS